jgi:hypothetical protein
MQFLPGGVGGKKRGKGFGGAGFSLWVLVAARLIVLGLTPTG